MNFLARTTECYKLIPEGDGDQYDLLELEKPPAYLKLLTKQELIIEEAERFIKSPTGCLLNSFYKGKPGLEYANSDFRRNWEIFACLPTGVVSLPIITGTLLAVWVQDGSNPIYVAQRKGEGMRDIGIIKVRTMKLNADSEKDIIAMLHKGELQSSNDPRVTLLGKWLRRLRIDELPQIYAILEGYLSLVGPRPLSEDTIEQLTEDWGQNLHEEWLDIIKQVKPGLGSLSAATLGNRQDKKRRELDIFEVNNSCPALDFYILLKSIQRVLRLHYSFVEEYNKEIYS